ncbi:hypothetical protein N657DRAFT_668906 [Parathielavia appendiculata]|uniref:Uncharacterized protein n=1 Tax=Parathielavia appendiculata TaxID=2587402 RepID=A0AAN6U6J4_9PEZI|nr:hypothetical protein N657DRAFT_668906 [Parathielavia appendiculata]
MRLSILSVLDSLGSMALAQVNSTIVIESLNTLTVKHQKMIEPAKQLSVANLPLLHLDSRHRFHREYRRGPEAETVIFKTHAPMAIFEGPEATAIAAAFSTFVKVHLQLLEALRTVKTVMHPFASLLNFLNQKLPTVQASVAATMEHDIYGLEFTLSRAF